jgi:hypothetical protein
MLNRPWFASGEGEQLAVLLPPSSQCAQAQIPSLQTVMLPSQYPPPQGSQKGLEDTVSAWGTQAIWNFSESTSMNIAIENASSCSSVTIGGQSYNFALFDPVYDEVEDRWYCNLSFSEPPIYGALMRLILARYQPHSANQNLMLSAPTIVDFALLNPTRVLRAKKASVNSVDVTVLGVAGKLGNQPNMFTVGIATEKDRDTTEFPWREPDSPTPSGTHDNTNVLWHGALKFDPLATNTIVVREYEQFPPFESQATPQLRTRLVYASSIDIP